MPVIQIPAVLRDCTGDQASVEIQAASTNEFLQKLPSDLPELAGRILDANGQLLPHIQLFVGDQRVNAEHSIALNASSELLLISPVAGG